jgi:hypothetical protein
VSVDDRQKDLVFSLALGNTSEGDFLREFPASSEEKPSLGSDMLRSAQSERDPDAVEAGIILGDYFGMGGNYVGVLERLAGEDWHRKHEDAVSALGKLASPTSVDPIYEAAQSRHAYLMEYDDGFALRSKAIHALRNIGTPEAVRRLESLFEKLQEPELRSKIVRRLKELSSEGASEPARSEARVALSRIGAGTEDQA